MSDITIYVDYISQPARSVLIIVDLFKIPCTIVEIRVFRGDHLTEFYKKISPAQTVPTLVSKNVTLYESHAIIKYLCLLYVPNSEWYPKNLQQKALVECYLHWHHLHIRFGCGIYLMNLFTFKLIYGKQFEDLEAMTITSRNEAFHMIEGILKQGLYVARTSQVTIADICCYCEIISLKWVNFDFSKYPFIQKWLEEIGSLESVKKVHQIFFKLVGRSKI